MSGWAPLQHLVSLAVQRPKESGAAYVLSGALRSGRRGRTRSRATVNDQIQPVVQGTGEYLLDRPQRLGILPSYWFWGRKENYRHIRWPQAILAGVFIFIWGIIPKSLPLWLSALVPGVAIVLALGLFERYIRRRAIARRDVRGLCGSDIVENVLSETVASPPVGRRRS